MRFTSFYKRLISKILILLLCISGICVEKTQANAFLSCQKISHHKNTIQNNSNRKQEKNPEGQVYEKIHLSQKEYARIEETGTKTLQNICRVSRVKRAEQGRRNASFESYLSEAPLSLSRYQFKYIKKSCVIHRLQGMGWQTIISYIHRKDGAKG